MSTLMKGTYMKQRSSPYAYEIIYYKWRIVYKHAS